MLLSVSCSMSEMGPSSHTKQDSALGTLVLVGYEAWHTQ